MEWTLGTVLGVSGGGAQVTLHKARSRNSCSGPGVRLLIRDPRFRPPNCLVAYVV